MWHSFTIERQVGFWRVNSRASTLISFKVSKECILLSLNHQIESHGPLVGSKSEKFLFFPCVIYVLSPYKPIEIINLSQSFQIQT